MNTLIMPIVGPWQSWGYRSRFDDRDTALEPTRSGVIGLICAALGMPRDADIRIFDCIRMGVRVDAPGRVMTDFHTAMDVARAGNPGTDTVTSYRHYLADARFTVGLESDNLQLLEHIDTALRHPVWPIFLGRKSFVPTVPLYLPGASSIMRGKTLESALNEFPHYRLWEPHKPKAPLRIVVETRGDEKQERVQGDRPVSFASRSYALRGVRTYWLEPESIVDGGVWPCTSQS